MPILTNKLSNKFPKFARYISLPLILIFTIPPIFLVAFAGIVGSYIGMSMFMLIGGYTMYEVFKNMDISKYSAIYLSMTILILFLLPWDRSQNIGSYGIKEVSENTTNYLQREYNLNLLFTALFSWKTLVIYFFANLVPLIFDSKMHKSKNIMQNVSIIIAVSFIIGFFCKRHMNC